MNQFTAPSPPVIDSAAAAICGWVHVGSRSKRPNSPAPVKSWLQGPRGRHAGWSGGHRWMEPWAGLAQSLVKPLLGGCGRLGPSAELGADGGEGGTRDGGTETPSPAVKRVKSRKDRRRLRFCCSSNAPSRHGGGPAAGPRGLGSRGTERPGVSPRRGAVLPWPKVGLPEPSGSFFQNQHLLQPC